MPRCLALTLLLAGCTTAGNPPDHPLVGTWQGEKTLTLKTTNYQFGAETGFWTAGSNDFRYKKEGGGQERCDFSLTGRALVMSGCRLAGHYTRVQ
jgi:outer membrane biogenesis lipoprotein LolB